MYIEKIKITGYQSTQCIINTIVAYYVSHCNASMYMVECNLQLCTDDCSTYIEA